MRWIERAFLLLTVLSAVATGAGLVMAVPTQPAGCDSQCRVVSASYDCAAVYTQYTYTDCMPCGSGAMCKSGTGGGSCKFTTQPQWIQRATMGSNTCNCVAGSITWVEASGLSSWTDPTPVSASRMQKTCQ